jgi:CrcB protein
VQFLLHTYQSSTRTDAHIGALWKKKKTAAVCRVRGIIAPAVKTSREGIKYSNMRYLLIALMGIIGALLRALIEMAFPSAGFPAGTLIINITACFALEVVYNHLGRRIHLPKNLISAMGVGMLGAFGTLSAFSRESLALMMGGRYGLALGYIAASMFGCFLAALTGHYVCRWLAQRRMERMLRQRAARRAQRAQVEAREDVR